MVWFEPAVGVPEIYKVAASVVVTDELTAPTTDPSKVTVVNFGTVADADVLLS